MRLPTGWDDPADLGEFIHKLSEFPPTWQVEATRSGSSVYVWAPEDDPDYGVYAYVFTEADRPSKVYRRKSS